jgi:hypothetical protein
MTSTPSQRSMQARAAVLTRWAKTSDMKAATAPARAGWHARFEKQLDEMGVTDPAERARRGAQLKKAYMTGLALKSARARSRRSAA